MIVEATYNGPYAVVLIPNSNGKRSTRDKDGNHPSVKIRVREGHPIGGCWDITKGKKEYEAGLKKAEAASAEAKKVRAARAEKTAAKAAALHEPTAKPVKKTSDGKGKKS